MFLAGGIKVWEERGGGGEGKVPRWGRGSFFYNSLFTPLTGGGGYDIIYAIKDKKDLRL